MVDKKNGIEHTGSIPFLEGFVGTNPYQIVILQKYCVALRGCF